MYGSLHAEFALQLLASNQHCDTLQECRLLTCSLLLMASSETRVDLPFALFRLAYLFPLFPPSASTCHDTHEDHVLRLAFPGEVVVDMEEIYLDELVCDPVPDHTAVPCRNVASCYSAPVSCLFAAGISSDVHEISSDVHEDRCHDVSNIQSVSSDVKTLDDDAVEFDFVDIRNITSGSQAFTMLCDEWVIYFSDAVEVL